jgi:glycosyltransferase involved in cell wall biosynthesis
VNLLELVVLTRDRPVLLNECLETLINQTTNWPWELIISDNSSNDNTSMMLSRKWPSIKTRRFQSIPAEEHFRQTIRLCKSKYLMMFHDDDLLLPGYIDKAITALQRDPSLCAVACNAYIMKNGEKGSIFLRDAKSNQLLSCDHQLLERYFDLWGGGAPPWSTYIYRSACLSQDYVDTTIAGKYSDLAFLLYILSHGSFLWLAKPYAFYRVHDLSDNSEFVFKDKLRLLNYSHKRYGLSKSSYTFLNAKAVYYRQHFEVSPSLRSLFKRRAVTRLDVVQKFITKMTLIRFLKSSSFRSEKIYRLSHRLLSSVRPILGIIDS